MPYTVKDAAIIKERAAGDLITATLEVAPEGAYLSAITKTGSAPLPEDARTTIPAAANVHLLQAGDPVPDTKLTDQDGASIALTDFKGSAVAVTFIYTRCPLAAVLSADRSALCRGAEAGGGRSGAGRQGAIAVDQFRSAVRSRRDTARACRGSSTPIRRCGALPPPMSRPSIAWPREFGVNVIREKDGTITHNLRTAIVDPDGSRHLDPRQQRLDRGRTGRRPQECPRRRALDRRAASSRRALPFTQGGARADRAAQYAVEGAALAERAALQHRNRRRDAAQFPSGRAAEDRALPAKRRSSPRSCSSSMAIPRW